ncbi:endonuclease/exonuclease/phosphatase family protein [Liquorilactobacillus uvarum]|uniref:Endonuclease exonuclease phosphatase family protein n=1 Tax=Liquorilactobacillus uvarum DSM 19971 TaxID=1423812 RepID=A0A0R1Q5N9_9LACO|nr:endonuclease/exonuclease/phosphatase family protein [Liquorilactobacillus uvarum]KRL38180.1 endonuclease exonuclease phosphatase family protein [Liquorilactobacillus uvarum DSM 19971]
MKILTLNCHTSTECDIKKQLDAIVDLIISEKITSFCLQEVKQARVGRIIDHVGLKRICFIENEMDEIPVRSGNFAFLLQKKLQRLKNNFSWTWAASHEIDNSFDEGLAIFSKIPFKNVNTKILTKNFDYKDQRRKKAVAAILKDGRTLINVHFSKQYKQFLVEWNEVVAWTKSLKKDNNLFLMGDFNIDAESNILGYTKICEHFQDTYADALSRGDGLTVRGAVKGWQDNQIGKRVDYILAYPTQPIVSSRIYFEGDLTPRISSHAGVVIETEEAVSSKNSLRTSG